MSLPLRCRGITSVTELFESYAEVARLRCAAVAGAEAEPEPQLDFPFM